MASLASKSPLHLFVSPSGQALSRWLEAFPRLQCLKLGGRLPARDTKALVWLRLDPDQPAPAQVGALLTGLPGAMLVVLADQPDDDQALSLFSAGIRGYCNAHSTPANLRQVAQVVQAGGLWIGPSLMSRLLVATSKALAATLSPPVAATPDPRLATLTQREREVAGLIAGGASNKEVGRALDISERTVKAHAGAIFEKLGARDRLHLALIVNGRDPAAAARPVSPSGHGGQPVRKTTPAKASRSGGGTPRKIAAAGS
ncbi:MAG: response regulator transcription factor [Rhodocyclales bacterium]|nr:response regulator transcription factor [Rhodocyclales bacterium]